VKKELDHHLKLNHHDHKNPERRLLGYMPCLYYLFILMAVAASFSECFVTIEREEAANIMVQLWKTLANIVTVFSLE
jgi:hypothetical protein